MTLEPVSENAPGILTVLRGGPHDGLVAATTGELPVTIVGKPHLDSFLGPPVEREAIWDDEAQWYWVVVDNG